MKSFPPVMASVPVRPFFPCLFPSSSRLWTTRGQEELEAASDPKKNYGSLSLELTGLEMFSVWFGFKIVEEFSWAILKTAPEHKLHDDLKWNTIATTLTSHRNCDVASALQGFRLRSKSWVASLIGMQCVMKWKWRGAFSVLVPIHISPGTPLSMQILTQ